MTLPSKVARIGRSFRERQGGSIDIKRYTFTKNDEGGGSQDWSFVESVTTRIVPTRTQTEEMNVGEGDREIVEYTSRVGSDVDIQRGDLMDDGNNVYEVIRVKQPSPKSEQFIELEDAEHEQS